MKSDKFGAMQTYVDDLIWNPQFEERMVISLLATKVEVLHNAVSLSNKNDIAMRAWVLEMLYTVACFQKHFLSEVQSASATEPATEPATEAATEPASTKPPPHGYSVNKSFDKHDLNLIFSNLHFPFEDGNNKIGHEIFKTLSKASCGQYERDKLLRTCEIFHYCNHHSQLMADDVNKLGAYERLDILDAVAPTCAAREQITFQKKLDERAVIGRIEENTSPVFFWAKTPKECETFLAKSLFLKIYLAHQTQALQEHQMLSWLGELSDERTSPLVALAFSSNERTKLRASNALTTYACLTSMCPRRSEEGVNNFTLLGTMSCSSNGEVFYTANRNKKSVFCAYVKNKNNSSNFANGVFVEKLHSVLTSSSESTFESANEFDVNVAKLCFRLYGFSVVVLKDETICFAKREQFCRHRPQPLPCITEVC